jgi:SAM-dependent methyltransferase
MTDLVEANRGPVAPGSRPPNELRRLAARCFWGANRRTWRALPARARGSRPVQAYGRWLHAFVGRRANREMYVGTMFLRNRPALELMRRFTAEKREGSTVSVTVLACSIGVELYSILWTLRRARPDLTFTAVGVDTSEEVLRVAEEGVYGPQSSEFVNASVFERLTEREERELFDWEGDQARVKPWLREETTWRVGDASDPELVADLGPQDIVVANNFLCHMDAQSAEPCLRNFAPLVAPGGHLFLTGVDLDLRTRVALELGWKPVEELLAEIHDGDPSVRGDWWPWEWWSLEPLDRRRRDWQIRYASVFQIGPS